MSALTIAGEVTLPGGETLAVTDEGYAATHDRPNPARRNFLAAWLWGQADNACTVCGLPTRLGGERGAPDTAILMHLVPAGPKRKGYRAGNIVSSCHACNVADGGQNLLPFVDLFAKPVPTRWPAGEVWPVRDRDAETERRKAARAALGLPY